MQKNKQIAKTFIIAIIICCCCSFPQLSNGAEDKNILCEFVDKNQLERDAHGGNAYAQYLLGILYLKGQIVSQNI